MRARYLLGAAALFTACQPAADEAPPFNVDAELGRWVIMWNTYDLNTVQELFVMDDGVSYLSSEREGVLVGPDTLLAHHAGMGFVEGGSEPTQELWVGDAHASAFGPTAVVTATWFFGDRTAPADSIQRGPMTAVYVWSGDRYRIAHMHFANYEE